MSSGLKRFVFDTSALIGAVLRPQSVPSIALELASLAGQLVASRETLAELANVLRRPHLDRYRIFQERMEFFERYRESAMLNEVTVAIADCRDPKDNKFLSLAVSTASSIIVASDEDLRVLHPYRDIQILSPSHFVDVARTFLKP